MSSNSTQLYVQVLSVLQIPTTRENPADEYTDDASEGDSSGEHGAEKAPSSLFATSSFSSSSFVLSVVKEEDTNDGGFSISMSSFSISSERGEWWSEESVCGPSAMLHAALKPLVNPNKNTKRIGNESKEKTRGMRQPDRFTLHEASKGTNTIRYRLRRNATWPVTFCSPRL